MTFDINEGQNSLDFPLHCGRIISRVGLCLIPLHKLNVTILAANVVVCVDFEVQCFFDVCLVSTYDCRVPRRFEHLGYI